LSHCTALWRSEFWSAHTTHPPQADESQKSGAAWVTPMNCSKGPQGLPPVPPQQPLLA
jgi:hypothetical protein